MKTKLLTVLVAVLLSYASFGQSLTFGPRAGINFSTIEMKADDPAELDYQYSAGISAGLVANYEVNELLSIQPELLFSQKGTKAGSFAYLDQNVAASTANYNYLEVPLLAKFSFGSDVIKGFVTGGPTVGYLLSGSFKDRESGNKRSIEVDGAFNRFEAGASFGVGTSCAVGTGAINLDVRYGFGLSNVYANSGLRNRNQVFGISVAYLFKAN